MKKIIIRTFVLLVMLFTANLEVNACTGIRLIAVNGGVVYGRTMEWGAFDLNTRIAIVPRGYEFQGITPDGYNGKKYIAKYGIIALDAVDKNLFSDGMNEKGLAVGSFYHVGFEVYQEYEKGDAKNCISSQEFPNYILSQFASVKEARIGLPKVKVVAVFESVLDKAVFTHWMLTDKTGESIVVEYNDGELKIHDAPLGVITNDPNYDWHITNLSNYLKLSGLPAKPKTLNGLKISPLGKGSGMLGLPGDYTPPSRFIRAVALTQTARMTFTPKETIYEVFRILDSFNVPLTTDGGKNLSYKGEPEIMRSSTIWTTAWNLEDLTLSYHTQHNRRIRQIDLKAIDFGFSKEKIKNFPLDLKKEQDIKNRTPKI